MKRMILFCFALFIVTFIILYFSCNWILFKEGMTDDDRKQLDSVLISTITEKSKLFVPMISLGLQKMVIENEAKLKMRKEKIEKIEK